MPEAAVAHHRDRALAEERRHGAVGGEAHPVAEHGVPDVEWRLRRERVASDVVRDVRVTHLGLARLEDLHRGEHGPLGTPGAERRRALRHRLRQHGRDPFLVLDEAVIALGDRRRDHRAEWGGLEELREAAHHEPRDVLAVGREEILAVDVDIQARLVRERLELALDEVRHTLLDHEDLALAPHERDELLGHQRMQAVQHEERDRGASVDVGEAELREAAERRVPLAALHDDAELALFARVDLVEPVIDDVASGRGQPLHELLRFHRVGERWQVDPIDREARRAERREHAHGGTHVVLADERATHVTGADADGKEHRLVARLGQAVALLDEARERLQAVARIEERHRGLERRGMRALLQDRRAFAVVFADDDEAATAHARGGDVRQGVGGDVRADDGLPRHRASDRIVDRRTEQRRGGGFAPRLLEVHPHRLEEDVVRVGEHVDHVRDGRAGIAADVADAGLEQRLGDREDAFAVEDLAGAVPELFDVFREGTLTHGDIIGVSNIGVSNGGH